jgi:hypothetical protein
MTAVLYNLIRKCRQHCRQRKVRVLLLQREQISKNGMSVFASVEDCMHTGISTQAMNLLRIRLRIRLQQHQDIRFMAYVFLPVTWRVQKGHSVRVQFLAWDMSQVIIKI